MSIDLRRFLIGLNAYIFLFDFILCYAIYTAYFEFKGITVVEIGLLLAFWSGSALVLEIWTGALSDWLDRRWLLAAAPLFKSLTFVCWVLADGSIWLYGLGFFMWSFGESLRSGTWEALLYERLKADGQTGQYDRLYGQASAAQSLGVAAGLLLGGFVAAANMDATFWLSLPPLIAAAFVALMLCDVRREPEALSDAPKIGYLENLKVAFGEFRTLPQLRYVTIYIAVGLILFEEIEEFDQLFYVAVDLPLWLFGVAAAAALGLEALGSAQAYRLANKQALAWILPAIAALLLILAAQAGGAYFVIILELAYLVVAPAAILSEARFQQVIEGRSRATSTSVLYFFQNVSALILAIGFGALAEATGILPAYGWAGAGLLPICVWIWWRQRRGDRAFAPPED